MAKKRMRVSNKTKRIAKETAIIGGTGAASALLVDSILSRVMPNSPNLLMVSRVAAGVGLAVGADQLGASDEVVAGIAAGPVLITGIDLATRVIGRNNVRPPLAGRPELAGAPWAPQIGF